MNHTSTHVQFGEKHVDIILKLCTRFIHTTDAKLDETQSADVK